MKAGAVRFSLRSLMREWRAGELQVLALAVVIAVAAVTSVGFFADKVQRAMLLQASELLGADLVVVSPEPIEPALREGAQAHGLETARFVTFPSVVLFGDAAQLAELKAVDGGYPLRGRLRTSEQPFGSEEEMEQGPAPGEVWVEARLFQQMEFEPGDLLQVGETELRVARVLTYEPDRGGALFLLAPRVMFNVEDVPATGLVTPASRVDHRLLVAGDEPAVNAYRAWAAERLEPNQRLEGIRDARPELRMAIERGEQFLGLAALVAVLLAGGAIGVAARYYSERQADAGAVMRCLGASRAFVVRVFALRLLWIAILSSLAGVLAGFAAQTVLTRLLGVWFPGGLPAASAWPVFSGLAIGLITVVGFALPSMLRVGRVPPLRVLRRELGAPPPSVWLVLGLAFLTLAVLLMWQIGDLRLVGRVLGGALITGLVLWGAAWGLILLLRPLRTRGGVALRFGLANLARRGSLSAVQLSAFGLGIMALLLLALVRVDMLAAWEQNFSDDAPNQFMINVQPDQVEPLQALFESRGLAKPVYHPMVRGRLIAINERAVNPEDYDNPRAERLAAREFNLSFRDAPQPGNHVVEGRWWRAGDDPRQWSVEDGLATTLGIELGDTLSFRVAGETVEGTVTNLRKVQWDSFNVNFFVVAPPELLTEMPATYITSFRLDDDGDGLLAAAVRQFPNVTVLDVRVLMERVRAITDRASLAVEYVFLFTLLAGVVMLFAAIQATRDVRQQETALLRTLGAGRRHVLAGLLAEFMVMGLLAGVLAAAGATLIGYVLAQQIFDLPFAVNPWLWIVGVGGGAAGVGLAGWLGARGVLRQPPLLTLRKGV
ncbi:ABC transporter permease [Thioalkalivibrio denitrificans]|uniref:ABC transporter permease n=1 Tax=Thioalkalivibrio denitrificans TaxID=108003 RepID=A0A1V3NFJ1_9GAMM|nr:FtsX-like permease family protein [Thioalkalivibrio denitrificans]OOG23879.1 ABC transporter permease [Thioalkalivibrio denitrificans]